MNTNIQYSPATVRQWLVDSINYITKRLEADVAYGREAVNRTPASSTQESTHRAQLLVQTTAAFEAYSTLKGYLDSNLTLDYILARLEYHKAATVTPELKRGYQSTINAVKQAISDGAK